MRLALVGQYITQDTADCVRLFRAGLGDKLVRYKLENSADELHQILMCIFPHLHSGGYEFLKLEEASRRQLTVVPPPTDGYIPLYIKDFFYKPVFI